MRTKKQACWTLTATLIGVLLFSSTLLAWEERIDWHDDVQVHGQCVHFARDYAINVLDAYFAPIGTYHSDTYAHWIWDDARLQPAGTERIANNGSNYPQHRDIIVWNGGLNGGIGHVGIVDSASSRSNVVVVDSNWHYNELGYRHTITMNGNVAGWFRKPSPPPPCATATVSWTSTPPQNVWYNTDQPLYYTVGGTTPSVTEGPDGRAGDGVIWLSQYGQGEHNYTVTVSNTCGSDSKTWHGGYDTIAPAISVTAPQPSYPYNTPQSVAWNVSDGNGSGFSWVQVQWDNDALSQFSYASGSLWVPDDSDPHTFKIRAGDNVGNVSQWFTYGPFIVDVEAPHITFLGPEQVRWLNSSESIIWAIAGASSATLQWDAGQTTSVSMGGGVPIPEGAHTAALAAVDLAGNIATAGGEYWIDLHAPVYTPDSLIVPTKSGCLDTLSAAWEFTDEVAGINAVSGVAQYEYWIGTTPGASDVFGPLSTTEPWAYAMNLRLTEGATYYITARAQDAAGNWSDAVTSSGILATVGPSVFGAIMNSGGVSVDARSSDNYALIDSMGQFVSGESFSESGWTRHGYWNSDIEYVQAATSGAAKSVADAITVQIGNVVNPLVVTVPPGVFDDRFYVEQPDRSSGIAAQYGPSGGLALNEGDRVWLTGKAGDIYGERALLLVSAYKVDHVDPLGALGFAVPKLGGGPFGLQEGITGASGLNNIGLLVRTWGKVTGVENVEPPALPTWFTIDDGSGINLKCKLPEGVTAPDVNAFVQVKGISSCERVGADLHRLLLVRRDEDIVRLR